jgi:ethanolamine utilization microcompartment shell protein EutL
MILKQIHRRVKLKNNNLVLQMTRYLDDDLYSLDCTIGNPQNTVISPTQESTQQTTTTVVLVQQLITGATHTVSRLGIETC